MDYKINLFLKSYLLKLSTEFGELFKIFDERPELVQRNYSLLTLLVLLPTLLSSEIVEEFFRLVIYFFIIYFFLDSTLEYSEFLGNFLIR